MIKKLEAAKAQQRAVESIITITIIMVIIVAPAELECT
jgi:hypothetical protein